MSAPYVTPSIGHRVPFGHLAQNDRRALEIEQELEKQARITSELESVGVKKFSHTRAEGRELHKILHDDEHIMGVAYGHYLRGFAMLLATNERILFLDKKIMFIEVDEVGYESVGGVSYQRTGPLGTIVLHTRIGDYRIHTMNLMSTRKFIGYIASRCVERRKGILYA